MKTKGLLGLVDMATPFAQAPMNDRRQYENEYASTQVFRTETMPVW